MQCPASVKRVKQVILITKDTNSTSPTLEIGVTKYILLYEGWNLGFIRDLEVLFLFVSFDYKVKFQCAGREGGGGGGFT